MITTICMNPCFDRTVEVDTLQISRVNRIRNARDDLGGKGINVAVVAGRLGLDVQCIGIMGTDGSSELCAAASKFTGITVRQVLFQDWKSEQKYNGIWACSSILHLNKTELKQVIGNIRDALLPSGIFYTSFKYGNFEGERNGRYFTDLTESSFEELINEVTGFEIVEEWITSDVRPGREEEKWLNVILKKI